MADTRRDWLTLSLVPGLGVSGFRRLVETLGSATAVFKSRRQDLMQIPGLRSEAISAILNSPPYKEAEAELKQVERLGLHLMCFGDSDYPPLLANIYKPPMVLYVKGNPGLLRREGLAVVGSRAATSYGLKIARELSGKLAAMGVVIFSGLALGIDTAAHAGTLEAGGKTVAVLGCGVDVCYPKSNWRLADQIAETGALVSQYRLGTQPDAFRFPERNRIISGLGRGVLVVEAAQRSGSLITARLALEEGREVFAIPGRVDSSKSAGTHRLLQEGAKLVGGIDDILDEMGWVVVGSGKGQKQVSVESQPESIEPDEAKILAVLDVYPKHIDTIILQAKLGAAKVNELLLRLELHGLVEALPGQQYRAVT